jgi:putative acetyltransferase
MDARYGSAMIRRYRPADEDDLIRVWLASTIPGQNFLSEEFWRSEEPVVREQLLPIAETWVVEEEGELVAFISLLEEVIGGLFTHPDHQRRGHGQALVKHVRERYPVVRVEVFRKNRKAIAFYEHCGFIEESAAPHPETGLEAVIMRVDGTPST